MCTLPADESNVLARCARDVVLAVLLGMIVRPEGQIGYAPIVAEVLADEGVAGVKRLRHAAHQHAHELLARGRRALRSLGTAELLHW